MHDMQISSDLDCFLPSFILFDNSLKYVKASCSHGALMYMYVAAFAPINGQNASKQLRYKLWEPAI